MITLIPHGVSFTHFRLQIIPMIQEPDLTRLDVYTSLDMEEDCHRLPCVIMINGQLHDLFTAIQLWQADYIKVAVGQSPEHLRMLIASPLSHGELTAMDVPERFSHLANQQAQHRLVPRADVIDIQAIQFQLALSHDARELYLQARLYTLPPRYIGLFPVTTGPTTYISLWHSVQRDPHGFFFDLLSRQLIEYEEPWMVYSLHPSIRDSQLPTLHPYVGLGRTADKPHQFSQLVFTETIIHHTADGTRST